MNRKEHIDRLYAAVQLFTPDGHDAGLLFRNTLDGSDLKQSDNDDSHRRSFYAKLVSSLRDIDVAEPDTLRTNQSVVKGRVMRDVVDQHFPSAFLNLAQGEQLLIYLTSTEGFDADSVAEITGFETDHASRQIESANRNLRQSIEEASGTSISSLLAGQPIPREWIAQNLDRFVSDYLDKPGAQTQRFAESRLNPGNSTTSSVERILQPGAPTVVARQMVNEGPNPRTMSNSARRKWLSTISTIVGVGLLGFFGSQLIPEEATAPTNVYQLSIDKARTVSPALSTTDAEAAERFVRTHFGRIIQAPELSDASLTGVGTADLPGDKRAPVFLYADDGTGDKIVVLGLTYGILNTLGDNVVVDNGLLVTLEDAETPLVENGHSQPVVAWRQSDDILLAVLPANYQAAERLF